MLWTAIDPFTHQRAMAPLARFPFEAWKTGTFPFDDLTGALAAQTAGEAAKVIAPQTTVER